MAVGFPTKVDYNTGDVLSAQNMNDLSGTVNLLQSAQYAAGKNQLINGAFDVWQRGTSFTASGYTADRMYLGINAGSGTLTRSTATPLPTGGSQYFARFTSGAASSNAGLLQALETAAVIPLRGKTVTASGYFRGTFTGNVRIAATYSNSTDALVSQSTSIGLSALTPITTSWERVSYTFTVPTDAVGLRVDFGPASTPINNTQTLDIWGMQLEVASTASEFATATGTVQGELAACQRYYYRTAVASGDRMANGFNQTTTSAEFVLVFPVTMRTTATALETSGTATDYSVRGLAGNTVANAVPTFNIANPNYGVFTLTVASGLTGGGAALYRANSANGYLGWSAEL